MTLPATGATDDAARVPPRLSTSRLGKDRVPQGAIGRYLLSLLLLSTPGNVRTGPRGTLQPGLETWSGRVTVTASNRSSSDPPLPQKRCTTPRVHAPSLFALKMLDDDKGIVIPIVVCPRQTGPVVDPARRGPTPAPCLNHRPDGCRPGTNNCTPSR
ncbi:uncharacterized protein LY79DRAFT_551074 [Colletotrichum navitas]|uniref:Uncharacterized protein n=1 Tax=Colletotrichum navitas TaxID=681940 RepID=A0AAD8Q1Y3_9PEZI|nr:uncharacterized protein LY79DRAFT_551074 [Colletotrichum navitas]KAK1593846.1 hypothetical protein LY79DRAFT_551074 [Colletotrichum navitas]